MYGGAAYGGGGSPQAGLLQPPSLLPVPSNGSLYPPERSIPPWGASCGFQHSSAGLLGRDANGTVDPQVFHGVQVSNGLVSVAGATQGLLPPPACGGVYGGGTATFTGGGPRFGLLEDRSFFTSRSTLSQCNTYAGRNASAAHYCGVCDKSFPSDERLQHHIEEDHFVCDVEGCNFSAPYESLQVHKLKHVKGERGAPVLDDPEEIAKWRASRKAYFPSKGKEPRKRNEKTQLPMSAIERLLRSHYETAMGRSVLQRRLQQHSSGIMPSLQNILKRRRRNYRGDMPAGNLAEKSQAAAAGGGGAGASAEAPPGSGAGSAVGAGRSPSAAARFEFTLQQLLNPFPICEHFLKTRSCRWGKECRMSHDMGAYSRWRLIRNQRGLDVPLRPSVRYEVMLPEIKEAEQRFLAALKFIVENDFFDERGEVAALAPGAASAPVGESRDSAAGLSASKKGSAEASHAEDVEDVEVGLKPPPHLSLASAGELCGRAPPSPEPSRPPPPDAAGDPKKP